MFPHGDATRARLGADSSIVLAVEEAQGEEVQFLR